MKRVWLRIVAFSIITAMFLCAFTGCKEETSAEAYSFEKKVFGVQTVDALEQLCQKQQLQWQIENELHVVYDVSCFDHLMQIFYDFSEDGIIDQAIGYLLLYGYGGTEETPTFPEYSAAELQEKLISVLNALCAMNGTELRQSFFVFDFETLQQLDITQEATYQQVKEGTAYLEFSLIDEEGFCWMITTTTMPDGVVFLLIEKHYNTSAFDDFVPNIDMRYA